MEAEKQLDELLAQQKAAQDAIDEFLHRERGVTLKRVQMLVQRFQFTAPEVFENMPKMKLPAKYRNEETGDEWSGRGKLPNWLQGKNPKDYLITKS